LIACKNSCVMNMMRLGLPSWHGHMLVCQLPVASTALPLLLTNF